MGLKKTKSSFLIFSWALYDLANQFFVLNIVSLYFVRWLTIEKKIPEIGYSLVFGVSTFFVAILAPVLGAVSDLNNRYRLFFIFFTMLSVIFTTLLGFTQNVFIALIFFGLANLGCQEAIIFYNALMLNISPKNKIGLISGIGKMFGYLGAIMALIITKPMILTKGYAAIFRLTGLAFFIFASPSMLFIKDKPNGKGISLVSFFKKEQFRQIFSKLKTTLFNAQYSASLRECLKAAFFGLCAINVILLFMSIYATKAYRLTEVQIIDFIAFSTIFAVLGSIVSGIISDRIGPKQVMIGVFFLWMICFVAGALLFPPFHFLIGALAGMSLGATWVIFRALVIKLVPQEMVGEVFGLFNLIGYAAGVVGPIAWGVILLILSPFGPWGYRLALLSLTFFMIAGLFFLLRLPQEIK